MNKLIYEIAAEDAAQREREGWLDNPLPDTPENARALADEFVAVARPIMWRLWGMGLLIRLVAHCITWQWPSWYVYPGEVVWCYWSAGLWWHRCYRRRAGRMFTHAMREWGAKKFLLPYFRVPYAAVYVPCSALLALGLRFGATKARDGEWLSHYGGDSFLVLLGFCAIISLGWSASGVVNIPKDEPPAPNPKKFMSQDDVNKFARAEVVAYLSKLDTADGDGE